MRRIFLTQCVCLMILCTTKGEKTTHIVEDFQMERITFLNEWWQNPTIRFAYPVEKYSDISLNYTDESNKAFSVQKGAENQRYNFRANSFYRDSTQLYYGKATYGKWNTKGANWNTIADVEMLSPYIIADTIGAKMDNEQYLFSGGYARRLSNISLGGFLSYRALTAYKNRDPRPKNTVSELSMRVASSLYISKKQIIGASFYYNKYQQIQNIQTLGLQTEPILYYLRGLGIADKHFSTIINPQNPSNNKYKQRSYGLEINTLPLRKSGILAILSFSKKNMRLFDTNSPIKDITSMQSNILNTEIGYKFPLKNLLCLAKIYRRYSIQTGKEYSYTKSNILSTVEERYKASESTLGLETVGIYKLNSKINAVTKFVVNYTNKSEKYLTFLDTNSSKKHFKNLNIRLQENLLWNFTKSSFLAKIALAFRHNIDKNLQMGALTIPSAKTDLVIPDFLFETDDYKTSNLTLRYDYQLKSKFSIYGKTTLNYLIFNNLGNRKYYQVAIGLAF